MLEFKYGDLRMKSGVYYYINKVERCGLPEYHNGYILMNSKKNYPGLVEAFEKFQEITYDKPASVGGEYYRVIGFDTAHAWNMLNNDYRTFNYVENELFKILDQWDKSMKGDNGKDSN